MEVYVHKCLLTEANCFDILFDSLRLKNEYLIKECGLIIQNDV